MEKTCSKCQQLFECKNEAPGCWCESFTLSNESLGYLEQNFDNCLCPKCIEEYAASKSDNEARHALQ